LGVKCTLIERKVIEYKAKAINLTVSEYLRGLAIDGQTMTHKPRALPKEVLLFTATLNHLAANVNQVAYHCNRGDDLTALKRAEMFELIDQIKELAKAIKNSFQ
jgi:hypothetical protein